MKGYEPTHPVTLRQTGDQESRIATDQDLKEGRYLTSYTGLTRREYFAAMSNPEMEGWSLQTVQEIMECEAPNDRMENLKYWAKFKAILKAIEADALIEALNKEKP